MAFYQMYEWNHAAMSPYRAVADATRLMFKNPINPFAHTWVGRAMAASAEMFERTTRRYLKPEFGIASVFAGGQRVDVHEHIVWKRPFCNLIHFEKMGFAPRHSQQKVLLVAPMSGHYATLLRGTVEAFLPNHEVYITDWEDARMVPLAAGRFDLDDYVDYVISMLHHLGEGTHVIAVCQPSVPVMAAISVMEARKDPLVPTTMTLMGGPIDTRIAPTDVNKLAEDKGIDWFRSNVIMTVPFPYPGFMRTVYPGFLQLGGFMSMNLDRHVNAHREMFENMVKGDSDSATKHKDFYDEYMAVMDLTSEFYLQTVDAVFIRHALPKGELMHRNTLVDPGKITRVALMTVEGENDDITGGGQTEAAHRLCTGLSKDLRTHYMQPGVGHYGVFNGSRFRSEIQPRIADFISTHAQRRAKAAAASKPVARLARTG